MQVHMSESEDGIILSLIGIIKKPDAMELSDKIAKIARNKPKKLALDCTQLATLTVDSAPFVISALERLRLRKENLKAFGCNNNVSKTFRGCGFERIGALE